MKWLALLVIRLYQRTISQVLPPSCRFVPSCSDYGYEAIARYGILRGGVMAVWRIMRCNPWGGHGYDPVPDLAKRPAGSDQQAAESDENPETNLKNSGHEDERREHLSQSFVLVPPKGHPQSFSALTPHAPGHSLTEGLQ